MDKSTTGFCSLDPLIIIIILVITFSSEDLSVDDILTHVKYRAIFILNSLISIDKMKYLLLSVIDKCIWLYLRFHYEILMTIILRSFQHIVAYSASFSSPFY